VSKATPPPPDDHLGEPIRIIITIKPVPILTSGLIKGVTMEMETEGPSVDDKHFEKAKSYQQLANVAEERINALLTEMHADYMAYVTKVRDNS
jgi:hypothetical protein